MFCVTRAGRLAATICLVACCLPSLGPSQSVPGGDAASARSAWKERQDRIRSARVTLSEARTTHRAYYELLGKTPGGKGLHLPEKDHLGEFSSRVLLRDREFRYSYTTKRWSMLNGKYDAVDYSAITTADGQSFVEGRPDDARPTTVSLSNRGPVSDETVLSLLPLMLTVRPMEPYQRNLSEYMPAARRVRVDGHACVEFAKGARGTGRSEQLYLDPACGWTLRRLDYHSGDKLVKRLTANYAPDPTAGWIPTSWTYVRQGADGLPLESGRVTVVACEVNPALTAEDIRVPYAPGTVVVDDTKGPNSATVEVIKDDGSRGVSVPVSQRPSHERLVAANESHSRTRVWVLVLAVGAVAILGVIVVRRLRDRSAAG